MVYSPLRYHKYSMTLFSYTIRHYEIPQYKYTELEISTLNVHVSAQNFDMHEVITVVPLKNSTRSTCSVELNFNKSS